jgi:hypothetical protein
LRLRHPLVVRSSSELCPVFGAIAFASALINCSPDPPKHTPDEWRQATAESQSGSKEQNTYVGEDIASVIDRLDFANGTFGHANAIRDKSTADVPPTIALQRLASIACRSTSRCAYALGFRRRRSARRSRARNRFKPFQIALIFGLPHNVLPFFLCDRSKVRLPVAFG